MRIVTSRSYYLISSHPPDNDNDDDNDDDDDSDGSDNDYDGDFVDPINIK